MFGAVRHLAQSKGWLIAGVIYVAIGIGLLPLSLATFRDVLGQNEVGLLDVFLLVVGWPFYWLFVAYGVAFGDRS